jgi:hypothetical protein
LNRLNILNRFKIEFKPRPGTVRAGPACRRPIAVLPRFSLFLPHPTADHRAPLPPGPTRQSCNASSPALRRSPQFTQQRPHPRPMAGGHCRPRPSPRSANRRAWGLSLPFSFLRAAPRGPPPPPFPLCSPRTPIDLEKTSVTHSAPRSHLTSSSPPSPPMCPPHRLPPPETPPPLQFPSERHHRRRFTLRPFHPPSLSPFEAALTFLLLHRHCRVVPPCHRPPELPHCRRTPPPEASSTTSMPRCHSV